MEFVGLAANLETTIFVDLIDRHTHALRRHPAIGVQRASLRLDLAQLDHLLRLCRHHRCDRNGDAHDERALRGTARLASGDRYDWIVYRKVTARGAWHGGSSLEPQR